MRKDSAGRAGDNRDRLIVFLYSLLPVKLVIMLAKKTSKNQITLPKAVADLFPDATYFDISAEEGRIVLVPVRPDGANRVRAKLADLGIGESDVDDAIAWARRE
jgi:hypothetical protein